MATRREALTMSTLGLAGAAYGLDWGSQIANVTSSNITSTGASLGSGYNNPSATFQQLFRSEFFGIDIRNRMFTQTKIKNKK